MIRKTACAAAFATAVSLAAPARALDGLALDLGYGKDDTKLWRVGAQWKWEKKWSAGRRWEIAGYWDLAAGAWHNSANTLYDFGLTPVFRLQRRIPEWPSYYFEAAIGFHLITELNISERRVFGSSFQFGDHLGAGVRFGQRGRYDISLRLQHVSNGSIRRPNPGIDFVQLRLAHHLD